MAGETAKGLVEKTPMTNNCTVYGAATATDPQSDYT